MTQRLTTALALLLAGFAGCAAVPAGAATGLAAAHGFAPHRVIVKYRWQSHARVRGLGPGIGVRATARALRQDPAVEYAAPDYIATASDLIGAVPNDPGTLTGLPGVPGGWVERQWNFLPWEGPATPLVPISPGGIDVVGAWQNLANAKRAGGRGVTVAVLDTGIAYRSLGGRFRRSPDFAPGQFVKGYDFVNRSNRPLDRNGHGTHVAGTIAEKTNNGIGLTGIAYRAKLMPVRVLDRLGRGRADEIARGIYFAAHHHANVINMSFNFGCGKRVPGVAEAVRFAIRHGVVVVASAGNLGSESCVSPPATIRGVIGVGGSTEGGCLGDYSLTGKDIDLLAPGGGEPTAECRSVLDAPIYQVTFKGSRKNRFAEPASYVGTSMAAAHVSGVAALILAGNVLDRSRRIYTLDGQVATRLKKTARSLGLSPLQEGAGLIDAERATDPTCQLTCFAHQPTTPSGNPPTSTGGSHTGHAKR
jgi:serine protease